MAGLSHVCLTINCFSRETGCLTNGDGDVTYVCHVSFCTVAASGPFPAPLI